MKERREGRDFIAVARLSEAVIFSFLSRSCSPKLARVASASLDCLAGVQALASELLTWAEFKVSRVLG